jgi:hypothetical protein
MLRFIFDLGAVEGEQLGVSEASQYVCEPNRCMEARSVVEAALRETHVVDLLWRRVLKTGSLH